MIGASGDMSNIPGLSGGTYGIVSRNRRLRGDFRKLVLKDGELCSLQGGGLPLSSCVAYHHFRQRQSVWRRSMRRRGCCAVTSSTWLHNRKCIVSSWCGRDVLGTGREKGEPGKGIKTVMEG